MFSSPMSHFLRHVFLAYGQQGNKLNSKLTILRQLQQLEAECMRMKKRGEPVDATLERVRRLKTGLLKVPAH